MTLSNADLVWYRSLTGDSEGGAISGVAITTAVDNNLFPDLNSADLLAGGTRYRKIYVANNSGSDTWLEPVIWNSVAPSNMTETIGLGSDSSDDTNAAGGALTQWSANAILQALSDGADTRTLTIHGLNSLGVPTTEDIVLNGTTPVNSTTTWSIIYGVYASALSGSRTVTVKQAAAGTVRGTIPTSLVSLWVWVTASTKTNGIHHVDVGAGTNIPIWRRQVWIAGASGVRPNDDRIKAEEA